MLQPTSCRFSDVWVNLLHISRVSKLAELLSSPVSLSGWCFHHHKTDSILFLIEQFQTGISLQERDSFPSKIIYPVHISRYFVAKKFLCCWFHKVQTELLRNFIVGGLPTLWSKAQVSSWLHFFQADTVLRDEPHLLVTTYQLIEDFSLFIHLRAVFWLASAKVLATLPCLHTKLLILIPWRRYGRGCVTPSCPPFRMQALGCSSLLENSTCTGRHHVASLYRRR